ncbi:hypothetical protein AAFF_G00371940, partial [Aldrovandia affinis]
AVSGARRSESSRARVVGTRCNLFVAFLKVFSRPLILGSKFEKRSPHISVHRGSSVCLQDLGIESSLKQSVDTRGATLSVDPRLVALILFVCLSACKLV